MPFDAQPILQGERLELRPLRAEDWEALYAVASDWLIWEQHPARNRHEIDVFRAFFDEALAVGRHARRRSIAPTASSSARRGFTATMRRSRRSRSGGRSSPGSTGAASTTAR